MNFFDVDERPGKVLRRLGGSQNWSTDGFFLAPADGSKIIETVATGVEENRSSVFSKAQVVAFK